MIKFYVNTKYALIFWRSCQRKTVHPNRSDMFFIFTISTWGTSKKCMNRNKIMVQQAVNENFEYADIFLFSSRFIHLIVTVKMFGQHWVQPLQLILSQKAVVFEDKIVRRLIKFVFRPLINIFWCSYTEYKILINFCRLFAMLAARCFAD